MALRNSALPLADFRRLEASWWALDVRKYTPLLEKGDLVQYSAPGVNRVILAEVLAVANSGTHSAVFKVGQASVLVRVLRVKAV